MGKITPFKLGTLVQILLFLNYSHTITADVLISKVKRNSPVTDDGVSTRENQPGENWIVVNEISCWESNGQWENVTVCQPSKIVTGHRLRFLSRTGLTGIQLRCTEKYNRGKDESESGEILEMISKNEAEINLPRGEWENWTNRSRSRFAVGFSFAPGEMNLRRSVKNFDVIYHSENENEVTKPSAVSLNSGRVVTKCPQDHAICGVKWMVDKEKLGILTGIGLLCCFHCVPEENWEIVHQDYNSIPWENAIAKEKSVGVQWNPNSANLAKQTSVDFERIARSELQQGFSAHIGKSNSTGFDWTRTANSLWKIEATVSKLFRCKAKSSCVFKQVVGQCGSARVAVDKFCQVLVPIGTSASGFCKELELIKSCSDALEILPSPRSPKQWIYPHGNENAKKVEVLCDFQVDGGGWTVIQKRSWGLREEFNRNWDEYSNGFGSLDRNFWLGLENIHALSKNGDQELKIELEDFEGEKAWAKYSSFSISDASDFYRLSLSGFSGDSTAGDSMTTFNDSNEIANGLRFSTLDKDNDFIGGNCAEIFGGGWWFCACGHISHLNGPYPEDSHFDDGIYWDSWKRVESLVKTEMKIRTRKSA